jgi:hypothetical protein
MAIMASIVDIDDEEVETTALVVITDFLEMVYPKHSMLLGRHTTRTVDEVTSHREINIRRE